MLAFVGKRQHRTAPGIADLLQVRPIANRTPVKIQGAAIGTHQSADHPQAGMPRQRDQALTAAVVMPDPHFLTLHRDRHHRQAHIGETHALADNLTAKTLAGIELQLLAGPVPRGGTKHPALTEALIFGHQRAMAQMQLADGPAQIIGGAGWQAHRGREPPGARIDAGTDAAHKVVGSGIQVTAVEQAGGGFDLGGGRRVVSRGSHDDYSLAIWRGAAQ